MDKDITITLTPNEVDFLNNLFGFYEKEMGTPPKNEYPEWHSIIEKLDNFDV